MREVFPDERKTVFPAEGEKEGIMFNEIEICALKIALNHDHEFMNDIHRAGVVTILSASDIDNERFKSLVQTTEQPTGGSFLELTPESASVCENAIKEQLNVYASEPYAKEPHECGHTDSVHVTALQSILKTIENAPGAKPN